MLKVFIQWNTKCEEATFFFISFEPLFTFLLSSLLPFLFSYFYFSYFVLSFFFFLPSYSYFPTSFLLFPPIFLPYCISHLPTFTMLPSFLPSFVLPYLALFLCLLSSFLPFLFSYLVPSILSFRSLPSYSLPFCSDFSFTATTNNGLLSIMDIRASLAVSRSHSKQSPLHNLLVPPHLKRELQEPSERFPCSKGNDKHESDHLQYIGAEFYCLYKKFIVILYSTRDLPTELRTRENNISIILSLSSYSMTVAVEPSNTKACSIHLQSLRPT